MNYLEKLQSPDIQAFIQKNWQKSPTELMLQRSKYAHLPMLEIVEQIHCLQKAKTKIPTWFATPHLIYTKTALEQCSSEITAKFKAQLVENQIVADLSGGLGVDTYFFAQTNAQVLHIEPNLELQNIVKYNYKQLKINNIAFFNATAEGFLSQPNAAQVFYFDPSRRPENQRTFKLEEGEPKVISLIPALIKQAKKILLKTSPFLDISLTIKQLQYVNQVWVLAVANEVKEVLYGLENQETEPAIQVINYKNEKDADIFDFSYSSEKNLADTQKIEFAEPQKYLYEPNAGILKAGGFLNFAWQFGLAKIHINSHLYTANELKNDIPARVFEIRAICKLDKKVIHQHLIDQKAHLTVRNFPLSVAEIRQKVQLKEGGEDYLFATTDLHNRHVILICRKVKLTKINEV
jgi:hypothetical protein